MASKLKLKTGMAGVEQAIAEQGSRSGDYIPKVQWQDNDQNRSHILRFLPDLGGEIIPVSLLMYSFVKADDGTIRDMIVPSSVGLDEPDWIADNEVMIQNYQKEWVPAADKPRTVSIAMAAYRKEEKVDNGGRASLQVVDLIENRTWEDKDGKKHSAEGAKIGMVVQSPNNFWDFYKPIVARYGHLSDRDYEVTRTGKGKDVKFPPVALDPVDGLRTVEDVLAHYKDLIPLSMEDWILARVATEENCKDLFSKYKGQPPAKRDDEDDDKPATEGKSYEPEESKDDEKDGPVAPSSGRMSSLRETITADQTS